MAFNKHEDGYAAVWKGKTEKAPTPGEGVSVKGFVCSFLRLSSGPALVVGPSGSLSHPQNHSPRLRGPPLALDSLCHGKKLQFVQSFRPGTTFSLPMSSANLED